MRTSVYILSLLAFAALAQGQTPNFVFTYEIGGPMPPSLGWYFASPTPADAIDGLAVVVTSGQPWLLASLSSLSSPSTLTVSVNPLGMAVGTYSGGLLVTSTSPVTWLAWSVADVSLIVRPHVSIAAVTNAALPSLDVPANTVSLPPRSMATIFGTNLAGGEAFSGPPWSNTLAGTEVHLARDNCFDISCHLVASLIYVNPSQINFLVPDATVTGPAAYRIVIMRNDGGIEVQGPMQDGPGRLILDPTGTADVNVVFQTGYDCLFSASLTDPAACGLSWVNGEDRAPAGAITDALTGELISPQNPVYQGRLITLWMTGLYGGVTLNSATGLQTANTPAPVAFGVAQSGNDLTTSFVSPMPLWAGESPQFVGLDQVNVAFPTCNKAPGAAAEERQYACSTCTTGPVSSTEKRYDAFLTYTSHATGTTARIYLPFSVRPGDPDCSW